MTEIDSLIVCRKSAFSIAPLLDSIAADSFVFLWHLVNAPLRFGPRLRVLGRLADWPTSLAPSICLAFVLIVLRAVLRVLGLHYN